MSNNEIHPLQATLPLELQCREFAPGTKLAGRYTLKKVLHSTLPGISWMAVDGEMKKEVNFHILPDSVAADATLVEELKRKCRKFKRLVDRESASESPRGTGLLSQIVRLHGVVEGEGWVALASDFVQAETLAQLLRRKGYFECKDLKQWVGQICVLIDFAHRSDFLHGDLCPENIRITESGDLLLANFGVSRAIQDFIRPPQVDVPKAKSGLTKTDDIYGIGALLYLLLCGQPPLAPNERETEGRKPGLIPISLRRKELGIKGERILPEWEKTIAACLDKNASFRPKNAIEIVMRLGGQRMLPAIVSSEEANEMSMERTGHGGSGGQGGQGGQVTFRSTVKPGGRMGFESTSAEQKPPIGEEDSVAGNAQSSGPFAQASPGQGASPALGAAPGEGLHGEGQTLPGQDFERPAPWKTDRQFHSNVFLPVERPVGQSRGLQIAALVLICLLLVGVAGGAFYFLAGGSKHPATVEALPGIDSTPAATSPAPVPPAQVAPTEPAQSVDVPTIAAATPTPAPTPAAEAVPTIAVPEPPKPAEPSKMVVLVQPQGIPEERSPLLKAAREVPRAISKAQAALEAEERGRQEKLQMQEKAFAALAEAQAAAEKAQAELLLKQTAVAEATKSVNAVLAGEEEKKRAIRDARADAARFQSVESQIRWLKQERAISTDSPESGAQLLAPDLDPAESLPEIAPVAVAPASLIPSPAPQAGEGESPREVTNTLGMKFVLVGDVRFSVWLTRVQDFEAYVQEAGIKSGAWRQPGFNQQPTHPVVNVSWKEASAFCKWLTLKEQKQGVLPANLVYRLPTDAEWSLAAGLPFEKGRSAQSRDMDLPGVYPWGTQWPPPALSGNFTGEETGLDNALKGYNDGFAWTSPVGTFPSNQSGLFDLGGNASQWCMDWWNEEKKERVIRGSSWANSALDSSLLSSARLHALPENTANFCGFRCVIAEAGY